MLLNGDHFLLGYEPVPATKGLRILCRVGIICSHVIAHDLGGIARNVETSLKTVLQLHPRYRFRADGIPCSLLCGNMRVGFGDE